MDHLVLKKKYQSVWGLYGYRKDMWNSCTSDFSNTDAWERMMLRQETEIRTDKLYLELTKLYFLRFPLPHSTPHRRTWGNTQYSTATYNSTQRHVTQYTHQTGQNVQEGTSGALLEWDLRRNTHKMIGPDLTKQDLKWYFVNKGITFVQSSILEGENNRIFS